MVVQPDLEKELQRLREPGAISRRDAETFLQTFALESIASGLQNGELDADLVAEALTKLLGTGVAADGLLSYCLMALETPAPALRHLAVRQLGSILQGEIDREMPSSQIHAVMLRLLDCTADPDVGVATEASRNILEVAKAMKGLQGVLGTEELQSKLRALSTAADPTVRMRGLSLAMSLAGVSPEAAATVREQGLLEPLAVEVADAADPLGCVAALQLVTQLAQQAGPGGTALVGGSLLPALANLVQQADPLLSGRALQAIGAILAAVLAAGADDPPISGGRSQTLQNYTLDTLESILAASAEAAADMEAAAFEVVTQISSSSAGAETLVSHVAVSRSIAERAFTMAGQSSQHVAAMHALAELLGVSRAEGEGSSAAALLSTASEGALQECVFAAAGRRSPAEVLWARLRQPFEELRISSYRLLMALGVREWGAREICSQPELLDHLCNPKSETSHDTCHWRHTCVQVLAKTAEVVVLRGVYPQHDLLAAAFPKLEAAARQGPYGAGATVPPAVATGTG